MAIKAPQFQPAASPVDTVAAPGPVFTRPAPVEAPRAPVPVIMQSQMPAAPGGNSAAAFSDALGSFSSSFSHLGAFLQDQYRDDLKKQSGEAEAKLAAMTPDEQFSYAQKVKTENKNRALVDGTMQAFGVILGARLQNDTLAKIADGSLSVADAPSYLRQTAGKYNQQFTSPEFAKAFGPAADQSINHFEGVALEEKHKEYKQAYIQSLMAWTVEARQHMLGLPEEQQASAIQEMFDGVVEKAGKSKLLNPSDVNTVLKTLATVAAEQGDVTAATAFVTKKRGTQPALIDFDPDAQQIIDLAQKQKLHLDDAHIESVKADLDLAAHEGRLQFNNAWQDKTALYKMGLSGDKIAELTQQNEAAGRNRIYERNPQYVQTKFDAIERGDVASAPSLNSAMDRSIWSDPEIRSMQDQAHRKFADRLTVGKAAAMRTEADAQLTQISTKLSTETGDRWMGVTAQKINLSDGSERTVSADEIKDRAMTITFQRIARTSGGDEALAKNRQVTAMIAADHIPQEIINRVKLAPASISTTAINTNNPEAKKQAFAGAVDGLSMFRAFDEQGGLDALRRAAGDKSVAFFQAADIMSQVMKGGDDIAALSDMAAAANRPEADVNADVVKIGKDQRIAIIKQQAIGKMSGNSGMFAPQFVDGSIISNLVQSTAENMVRSGVNEDIAVKATSQYISRAYQSYKGLVVPKNGDKSYEEIQDFYTHKVAEANPDAARALGDMALVPSLAASVTGRSGAHVLRSTENGAVIEPMNPVTLQTRNGPVVINDPVHVSQETIASIRDAMRYDMETKATTQAVDGRKVDLTSLPSQDQGNLARSALPAYDAAKAAGKSEDEARSAGRRFMLDRLKGVDDGTIKGVYTLFENALSNRK